ncbi:MAG: biotin--[acetyl-CoA-carboxylase] ligase [Chitinispirillia bacterium]|nr:biotin--[acetyl-CoA-carboxylase] ligase [Chitinispirillia bacterium]
MGDGVYSAGMAKGAPHYPPPCRYIFLDEIDSTNSYAKSLGDFPEDGTLVIRAGRQTGGRGRGGNLFFSDNPGGIWASIVTPISDISAHFEHNRAVSLAILDALKHIGGLNAPVLIKWPNDIYWGERKITGILLENVPGRPNRLIIGFGINVNMVMGDFPEELRARVTSVREETGTEAPLDRLLEDIICRYIQYLNNADLAAVHKLYFNNLYRVGAKAVVGRHTGTFVAVDTDGRLRLATDSGDVLLSSGTLRFLEDGSGNE